EIQKPDGQDIAISITLPNTSSSDNSSSSSGTGSDADSDTGTQSNDGNTEFFTHTRIIASYDQMIRLSSTESNARALEIIFGWTDPLVYGNYEKVEEKDKDGNVFHIYYLNSEDTIVGWEISKSGNKILYEYHFPGDAGKYILVIRNGTLHESIISRIQTGDPSSASSTNIHLRQPDDPESYKYGVRIEQKHAGVHDGLNTDRYFDTEDYTIWSEGKPLEFYTFEENVMTKSVIWEYKGGDEIRIDTFFYENGNTMKIDSYKNRQKDGVFLSYYENENLRYSIEYKNDELHGISISYYENGRPKSLTTYENGEKNGLRVTYFDNEAEQIETEYTIKNGKTDGVWYKYDETGRLLQKKTYKEGILDGPYLHNDFSSDYYAKGQYTDGNETGLWEHGSSKGWHYKVEYDGNGRKLWDWYIEKGYITYYNEDGSVSHTEEQGQN
ncbi:MAG: toxin-antitoxin system YwqK family antitoxin, partial [Clostridia bacterium]|nr:toxin-antitoxin system YwqK family antitoxin [Clostridia bacterium]